MFFLLIWHGIAGKITLRTADKNGVATMSMINNGRPVRTSTYQRAHSKSRGRSNHCRRRAGLGQILIYYVGHSNWNIAETGEYLRKPLVPKCSAMVKLSAGMQHVNRGSK